MTKKLHQHEPAVTAEAPELTHFGFSTVSAKEKAGKVKEVFDSVSDKYDLMNDVMSLGLHRIWKTITVELARIRPGQRILDVAAGSGDLSAQMAKCLGDNGEIWVTDINGAMLKRGRSRLINQGFITPMRYALADAQQLPFPDNYFDCITIGFGLRNVTDQRAALASLYRVLKPAGQLLILEFSKPRNPLLAKLYDQYSFSLIPKFGEWFADDRESYQYLVESIRMHPNQEELKKMILTTGFHTCHVHNFCGGVVALHRAIKV